MGQKREHHRRRSDRRDRRREQPSHDWDNPFPRLRREDRVSTLIDYRDIVPDYDAIVTEFGEEAFDERMDQLFFFLGHSARLLDEPEFRDASVDIDPHDFLVFEAADVVRKTVGNDESPFHPDGGYVEPYEHILRHAMHRYLTPALRSNLRRRARRVARRRKGTGIGAMASALQIAITDEGMPTLAISLLQKLFSDAILEAVLNHDEQWEREWEERDRSLDRWMEQIAAADFDRPAEQAVQKLAAAGTRALPHLTHLFIDTDRGYDDYAVATAFQIFGRIPSQLSLWVLVQGLLDDDDWASEEAADRLAELPRLACPYFHYALTVPAGPEWLVALWGYDVLARAQCPGAFELLVEGLSYVEVQPETPHVDLAEGIQASAGSGLVELGDERAIPVLRDWLRDPQANLRAREELLYELVVFEGGHPWADDVVGDLTPETLPN